MRTVWHNGGKVTVLNTACKFVVRSIVVDPSPSFNNRMLFYPLKGERYYYTNLICSSLSLSPGDFQVPIPMTEGLDPISMLTDGATIAKWNNEGLPGDKISTQNATILTNCERWPLLIDPQLQGIKWLKSRYGIRLKVINLSQKG